MDNQQKQQEVDTSQNSWSGEDTSTRLINEADFLRSSRSDTQSSPTPIGAEGGGNNGGSNNELLPSLEITSVEDQEHQSGYVGDTAGGDRVEPAIEREVDDKTKDESAKDSVVVVDSTERGDEPGECDAFSLPDDADNDPASRQDSTGDNDVDEDNVFKPDSIDVDDDDSPEFTDGEPDGAGTKKETDNSKTKEIQAAVNTHINSLALRNPAKRENALNSLQAIGEAAIPALVNVLGSRDWPTRDGAQRALEGIGEAALPSLANALKSDDPEVRSRAESATERIKTRMEREDREKVLNAATTAGPKIDELLKAAHMKVDFYETNQGITEDGPVGTNMQLQDIDRGPTMFERRAAEDLLKTASQPTFQGERFEKAKRTLMEKADKEGDTDTAAKLTKLGLGISEGRTLFARSLGASDDPADLKRGRELVNDQLQSNPNKVPSRLLTHAAAELSMDKDEAFMQRYDKAGGEPLELKIFADEARKKQARRRQ